MAGRNGIALVQDVSTGTDPLTLIQLVAATNHAIAITELCVGFAGQNPTHKPILVELLRQTTAGTGSSLTLRKTDDSIADTFDTTGQHAFSAEPSAGEILRSFRVHPQLSLPYPFAEPIIVGAGDRIGLRVTAENDVKAEAHLCFEE